MKYDEPMQFFIPGEMVRRLWTAGKAQVPKAKWRTCHKPSGAANIERDIGPTATGFGKAAVTANLNTSFLSHSAFTEMGKGAVGGRKCSFRVFFSKG